MVNYLHISDNFAKFVAWIGGSCKPSDKGKLTPFPRFTFCQHNFNNVSSMLSYEELPEINSERWLSLEDFPGEEWKNVIGFEIYYMISNYGRVKSLPRVVITGNKTTHRKMKIRKLSIDKANYVRCSLNVDGKTYGHFSISRLVAKHFLTNPENKPQVDHISTIRTDNRVCNLRYVTRLENAHNPITEKKVLESARKRRGEKRPREAVERTREKLKNGASSFWGKKGSLHPRAKAIIQLSLNGEYIRDWDCITDAQKIYGCHVISCARGNRNQCGGYKWKYK